MMSMNSLEQTIRKKLFLVYAVLIIVNVVTIPTAFAEPQTTSDNIITVQNEQEDVDENEDQFEDEDEFDSEVQLDNEDEFNSEDEFDNEHEDSEHDDDHRQATYDDDQTSDQEDTTNNTTTDTTTTNKPTTTKPVVTPKVIEKKLKTYQNGDVVSHVFNDRGQTFHVKIVVVQETPMVEADTLLNELHVPATNLNNSLFFETFINDHDLIFQADKQVYYDNGVKYLLPVASVKQANHFYIPIRLLADQLQYEVSWNGKTGSFEWKKVN